MFGPAGHAYVYFIYGMHFCLNVVTEVEGIGAAVLLRALRPVAGVENMQRNRGTRTALAETALCRGPGNLCRALGIDRTFNGLDLCASGAPLRLYAPERPVEIGVSVRIGVSGDALAREAPWRFFAVGTRRCHDIRAARPQRPDRYCASRADLSGPPALHADLSGERRSRYHSRR